MMAKVQKPGGIIVDAQKPKMSMGVSFQGYLLFLLIVVAISYFISAHMFANNYIHIVDVSDTTAQMPMISITSAPGELITFGIHIGMEDKTPWASPSGFRLVLHGLDKPLQLVEPSQPYWASSGSYVAVWNTHFDTPRILWGSIVLPESMTGLESRHLVGEIQGNYVTPFFSTLTYHIPVQIQMVPQGIYLWTNGKLPFYILTGISGLLYTLLGLLYWKKSKQEVQSKGSFKRYVFNVFKILVIYTVVYGLCLFWANDHFFDSDFTDISKSMGLLMLIIFLLLILNWRSLSQIDLESNNRYRTRTRA